MLKGWPVPLGVAISFSLLGLSTGYLTGNSRDSAVHVLIPAVLGLIGAVMGYLFVTRRAADRTTALIITAVLPIFLLYGSVLGAQVRMKAENCAEIKAGVRNLLYREVSHPVEQPDLKLIFSVEAIVHRTCGTAP